MGNNSEISQNGDASPTVKMTISGHGLEIEREVPLEKVPMLLSIALGEMASEGMDARPATTALAVPKLDRREFHAGKPLSVVEYMDEKNPKTMADTILVLTMYAELYEEKLEVTRSDLRRLLKAGRLPEPANFSRDVGYAIQKGYLLEIGKGHFAVTKRGMNMVRDDGAGDFGKRA